MSDPTTDPADDQADDVDTLSRKLLLLSALEKRVTEAKTDAKQQLRRLIRPGTTVRPLAGDGKPIGSISYAIGRETVTVTDPEKLADWVAAKYPTEVTFTVQVKDAFLAKITAMTEAAGIPCGPGGETAEDAPPGIAIRTSPGYVSARPDPKRADVLWREIRAEPMQLLAGITDDEDLGDTE